MTKSVYEMVTDRIIEQLESGVTMANLIELVQTTSQKNVILAGTRTALAQIAEGMDANLISELRYL